VSLNIVFFLRCGVYKCGAPDNSHKCYRVNPVLIMECTMKMMMNGTLLTKRWFLYSY